MQTIHSRTYTNVALTALILLLLVLALRPYVSAPAAYAATSAVDMTISSSSFDPAKKAALLEDPYAGVAAGLREVAATNKEIAAAIRETAKAQDNVAKAISTLGAPMGVK